LPKTYQFVGPSIVDRKEKAALNLNEFSQDKKLVYISLGTIVNKNLNFYKTCFKAFADMDLQVVLAVGNRIRIDDLGEIPENFSVFTYVSQLDVLTKASVFITHGGMNSVHESILKEVPMIVIPQQTEA